MSDALIVAKDEKGRFVTGNIGGGRQKGSRNKLGEAFIQALHDSFIEHGPETIETVRTEKPDQYLKVIASLLPKDVNLNINDSQADLTDDEIIDRIRNLSKAISPFLDGGTGKPEVGTGEAGSPEVTPRIH